MTKKSERATAVNLTANAIETAFKANQKIDYEKLIYLICDKVICARRTAIEYINTALSRFNWEFFKEGNIVFIREKLFVDGQSQL
jgi:flagellar motor component MotA